MALRHSTRLTSAALALSAALVAACVSALPTVPETNSHRQTPDPTATARQAPNPTVPLPTRSGPSPTAQPSAVPTAQPTPQPTAPPTPVALEPKPRPGKFEMDIGKSNAFVRQATTAMCVPASMQIMINLMSDAAPDRTRETQRSLYTLARSYSPWITPERDGAAANGWAAGLNHLGFGQFQPMSIGSMDEALKVAAMQMRMTTKPVGLIVWAGDHAWVMSGFKSTADPAWTTDFEVTGVWVEDPWFGRTDRTWGAGLQPHTFISHAELAADFVGWPSRYFMSTYGEALRYVIVAPLS